MPLIQWICFPHWTWKISPHQSHTTFSFLNTKPNKLVPSASLQSISLNLLSLFFDLSLFVVIFQCGTPIRNTTPVVIYCWIKHQLLQPCPNHSWIGSLHFFIFCLSSNIFLSCFVLLNFSHLASCNYFCIWLFLIFMSDFLFLPQWYTLWLMLIVILSCFHIFVGFDFLDC